MADTPARRPWYSRSYCWLCDVFFGSSKLIKRRSGHVEWFSTTLLIIFGILTLATGIVWASVTHDIVALMVLAALAFLVTLGAIIWRIDVRSRYVVQLLQQSLDVPAR